MLTAAAANPAPEQPAEPEWGKRTLEMLLEERSGLPEWAQRLVRSCLGYSFATQRVFAGRSVIARKVGHGPGPAVVISGDEDDLRAALGLDTEHPADGCRATR